MSIKIDDAYLYEHMPKAEQELMDRIPPEEELDHQFSRRFERKMKKLMKEERRTEKERKVYRGVKLAVAIAAVIVFVVFGSAMSVQAYRSKFIQFVVEMFEELTSFSGTDRSMGNDELVLIEPGYVPKGYEKTGQIVFETNVFIVYVDSFGNEIRYRQEMLSNPMFYMDSEDAEYVVRKVKGNDVIVYSEGDDLILYWSDQEYSYYLRGSVTEDELTKMAKGIMRNK